MLQAMLATATIARGSCLLDGALDRCRPFFTGCSRGSSPARSFLRAPTGPIPPDLPLEWRPPRPAPAAAGAAIAAERLRGQPSGANTRRRAQ